MHSTLTLTTPRLELIYIANTSESAIASRQPRGRYQVSCDGTTVGSISLVGQSSCHGEIGYTIEAEQRGKGFASEGVGAVIASAIRDHGIDLLSASVWSDNTASRRVLEKNGFRSVGSKLCWSQAAAKPRRVMLYRWTLPATSPGSS
jgi:RimJ/RimL family protein N-acetyltransferase